MTREEFIAKATSPEGPPAYANVADWVVEAGALLGALSLRPETDHDVMVEAIQKLALRMPATVVMASTAKLRDVVEDYVL